MKNLLQKSALKHKRWRSQADVSQVAAVNGSRQAISKAFAIVLFCALVTLPQFGFSQATVTDPARTNPAYASVKKEIAKKAFQKSPKKAVLNSNTRNGNTSGYSSGNKAKAARSGASCFIPRDASYTVIPRNDDGSYGPIALDFDFNLYGATYNQVWINTNGTVTFTGPLAIYNPLGFPYNVPMIAGFWGDVDTNFGGQIYFKQTATSLIATWDAVEPYGSEGEFSNTFQIILTDGIDPVVSGGRNVAINHQNIEWAFGAASPYEPATVGINHGNGIDYVQVGLFLFDDDSYDGPGGNYDGMYYLDGLCSNFRVTNDGNIEPSATNLPRNNTVNLLVGQSVTLTPQFIGPETNQTVTTTVNTTGMCGVTSSVSQGGVSKATITITGSACNVGTHTITLSATDNGIPAMTTVETITVNVTSPCNTVLTATKSDLSCPGASNGSVNLHVSGGIAPFTYAWSNGSTTKDLANLATGTYTVTVTDANNCVATTSVIIGSILDQIKPTILAPAALQVTTNNNCLATGINLGTPVATDNCTLVTVTNNAPASFPVGTTTVTWTATDASGNTATATQLVTVSDNQAPVAKAKNISVMLVNGNATISASQVNNESSDNCGIASISLNKTTFDCTNTGKNVVTLTVTDTNGNVSTATAIVNVIGVKPTPVITVSRIGSTTSTGTSTKTISMGYGNQKVMLTASNPSSAANATRYFWSPAAGLSSLNIANPVFTATTGGSYTFTVTAINETGCSATEEVTINVADSRCGNKMDKVLVCHNGHEICISANAVPAHLAHGCQVGHCGSSLARTAATETPTLLEAYPNPFSNYTNLQFTVNQNTKFQLEVLNVKGALVQVINQGNAQAGKVNQYAFEAGNLPEGIYIIRLVTDSEVIHQKMILKH